MSLASFSRAFWSLLVCGAVLAGAFVLFNTSLFAATPAHNIKTYSDTISDSRPLAYANHTLHFTMQTTINPGGYFEITPPEGFEIPATSTFEARNVEVLVNGIARDAGDTLDADTDQVIITAGSPGSIRYNLNPTTGINSGSVVTIKIGNDTSGSVVGSTSYSTTTGTTTIASDIEPIRNASTTGTQLVNLTIGGAADTAYADFSIALVNAVGTGNVDTTEDVPPVRSQGAPTGNLSGTTQQVEVSLHTDELADCKYAFEPDIDYDSMPYTFTLTGQIVHSFDMAVASDTDYAVYVRCVDDEGNKNIDDYLIAFTILPMPTGTPNGEGDVEGDGSGSGDSGAGGGSGTGSNAGGTNGSGSSSGSSSGGGGSGGGSGGRSGPDDTNQTGGGFEAGDAPYRSGDAQVIITGYAFPGSTVYALVDGSSAASARASNNGSYSVTIDAIARGVYTFGVYAMGSDRVKSSTFSTSFTVTGGRTSNLSNINVMPSVSVNPDPVNPGQQLTISGYSIPNAEITVENQNSKSTASLKSFTTTSDGNGRWSLSVDTNSFSAGTYKVRAKAKQLTGLGISTNFSDYTFYGVGQSADVPLSADLNTDGKINLTDFSILLFWWGGDGGDSNPPADINRDGKVNLTDFSIMLFNWTG